MSDDIRAAVDKARSVGVEQFVHVGCTRVSQPHAVRLAAEHSEIFAAIGIHPHEASTTDAQALADLERLAGEPKVVAIGETGLDYHYNLSAPEQQRSSLAAHVELARRLEMPLVLHIREAHDEALTIVRDAGPRPDAPGMVHCFTAGPAEAEAWLSLGFHLSFSGISTFPKAEEIREAVRLTPDDRILLETDAPYLAPVPMRGTVNQPGNVAFTCQRLAEVRGVDPHTLATQAAQNTRALLAMPEPAQA